MVALGLDKLYNAENPFDWMEAISLQGKTKCVTINFKELHLF
jgi:ribonucleotide reductase beta subunit family protein with ferritin-like domain